jgi:peroxiredoxin
MTAPGLAIVDTDPTPIAIGCEAPPFDGLRSVDGGRVGLADFADARLVVLIFASNRCPTVHAYRDRLNDLVATYAPRGVAFAAINSNPPHLYPEERFDRMATLADEMGWQFPYLEDADQAVARRYGPTRTFHVFVLDEDRRVRYHGRFDDARLAERATTSDLRDALDDLLAGRPVATPVTKAFGCSLDYP